MNVNGIYKAIITDNTDFFETGKIKVRVSKLRNTEISWDLVNNYSKDEFYQDKFYDADAFVSTSIGGDGAGIFSVPQINTVGMVQFLNGNIHTPIWTGSFYSPIVNENDEVLKIPIPDDDYLNDTGAGAVRNSNDSFVTKRMKGNNATVIFRQKKTGLPNENSDSMNWDKQRTSNLIVIDENEILITHFSEWKEVDGISKAEKYEQIKLGLNEDGEQIITTQIITEGSGDNVKKTGLEIEGTKTKIKFSDEETEEISEATVSSEGVILTSSNDKTQKDTKVSLTPEEVKLINKDSTISLNGNDMIIDAIGDIRLGVSNGNILLGGGSGFLVVADKLFEAPVRLEDGGVLRTVSKVKG